MKCTFFFFFTAFLTNFHFNSSEWPLPIRKSALGDCLDLHNQKTPHIVAHLRSNVNWRNSFRNMKRRPDYARSLLVLPCSHLREEHHPNQTPGVTHASCFSTPIVNHFLALCSGLSPFSIPNATPFVSLPVISCLPYCNYLLTSFSAPLLLLPPQIHAFWATARLSFLIH